MCWPISFSRIALSKRHTCDFTLNSLRDALTEVVASFPVYRTYVTASGLSENDARYIRTRHRLGQMEKSRCRHQRLRFCQEVLLTRIAEGQDIAYQERGHQPSP